MKKKNNEGIAIGKMAVGKDSYVKDNIIQVVFYNKIKTAAGLSYGDVISFKMANEILVLKYITSDYKTIARNEPQARLRNNSGTSSMLLSISEARIPELFKFDIPNVRTQVKFEIVGEELHINLSEFEIKKPFGNIAIIEPEPVLPKQKGFGGISL